MLTEATMQRDALAALYNYCLHQVPGMSEYGDGAKEMRAARLALGTIVTVNINGHDYFMVVTPYQL